MTLPSESQVSVVNERISRVPIIVSAFLGAIVLIGGLLLVRDRSYRSDAMPLPTYDPAPAFSLTDSDNNTLTSQALIGHPWVCNFIYTMCPGPCSKMTANMVALQKAVPGPDIRFVSFSLDPTFDKPAVLKKYAKNMGGDPDRWHLLTGSAEALYAVARGLHLTAIPATGNNPIQHDERFLLIDASGHVRGIYSSNDPEKMTQLEADLKQLASEIRKGS